MHKLWILHLSKSDENKTENLPFILNSGTLKEIPIISLFYLSELQVAYCLVGYLMTLHELQILSVRCSL
jgi:hypothetical protein